MRTKDKEKIKALSLIEAVDTLSKVADRKGGGTLPLFDEEKVVNWLKDTDNDRTLGVVKQIFKVILAHLKASWDKEYQLVPGTEKIESIKTIMLLVGESAKKLDGYTELFNKTKEKSVTDLIEYIELKKFYQSKISHVIDENVLSQWLFNLTKGFIGKQATKLKGEGQMLSQHVYIDLDQIKNDSAYELLFIRKEDGSRFFNPKLIRNMKLVIDFGGTVESLESDPLRHLSLWHDRIANHSAKAMLKSLGSRIDHFFKETARYRSKSLSKLVSSAIMALYMASSSENSRARLKAKTCIEYLVDFEDYLHMAITSPEYQKMIAYPPKATNHLAIILLDTIHALVRAFFIHFDGFYEIIPMIEEMIHDKKVKKETLAKSLQHEYDVFKKAIKSAMHGPMIRNMELIENWESKFAPILQKNWPAQLYSLYLGQKRILCLKLPSPTTQEYIHKAYVLEEFLAFLRGSKREGNVRNHMMFNLQDRTSWKEYARCQALEGLSEIPEFDQTINVITVPLDTDFYNQHAPYDQDKEYSLFKQHFIEQLQDGSTGFYFPRKIEKVFKEKYLASVIDTVHKVFFQEKKKLSREERLDFITIAYLMLYLKCIEVVQPDSISFTCKDGLDSGTSQSALLFIFYKLLQEGAMSEEEMGELHQLLFAQQLLVRERTMLPERFGRMITAVKVLESVGNLKRVMGMFDKLINPELFDGQIVGRHR